MGLGVGLRGLESHCLMTRIAVRCLMRKGGDKPQIASIIHIRSRISVLPGADLEDHRSVLGAIGHTADDTQSTTVEALGSCSDRANITPNGCDSSEPSSHVPSYQCIIMVHVLIGKISGGVCGDDRFSVQSCHKTVR